MNANYQWGCTEPTNGERIIPNKMTSSGTTTADTKLGQLYVVPVVGSKLEEACYGNVYSVKYCYKLECPSTSGSFQWSLYLLKQAESTVNPKIPDYTILDAISLNSIFSEGTCACNHLCCEEAEVNFELREGFAYGVAADVGNSPGIHLQAFHDSYERNQVDTFLIPKDAHLDLTIGSTFKTRSPAAQTGLRMVWFKIGKLPW